MRRSTTAPPKPTGSPAKQLAGFVAKFDPAVATVWRAARAKLRKRLPTANELIYDNYNFFVIGFGPTERSSDCITGLAASKKGVVLSFYWGATLPDPRRILLGGGSQHRFVRLDTAARLDDPSVAALITAAIAQARTRLPSTGRGRTIIKSISAKQRPRRSTNASPKTARRRQ